jgi:UDP-N-acetylglucosamine--N-acetylmuramyl-(pentapeptide) pyrophosphoryl-undecaprenol N-acetylglucosamine transferase
VDEVRAIIAGGGTGGHLFPGIAVARELEKRFACSRIVFVVGKRPLEVQILSRYGYSSRSLDIEGLKGGSLIKKIKVFFKIPGSLFQAAGIIREFSPHFVLGVGGYSSGPICLAARIMGVPSAIHEQNSYPGLTNRLLARFVDCVFVSFEESAEHLKCRKMVITGNPVREELIRAAGASQQGIEEIREESHDGDAMRAEERKRGLRILIVGGSQGAVAINDATIEALRILKEKGRRITVIHQTGRGDYERISRRYRELKIDGEVSDFINDMAQAYNRADLVISRAGATTIFELAATGRPSVLIPYPYAANNHQETNALSLVRAGAAEMVLQKDLTGNLLADLLIRHMDDRKALSRMSQAAVRVARPDAAKAIVNGLVEIALS